MSPQLCVECEQFAHNLNMVRFKCRCDCLVELRRCQCIFALRVPAAVQVPTVNTVLAVNVDVGVSETSDGVNQMNQRLTTKSSSARTLAVADGIRRP